MSSSSTSGTSASSASSISTSSTSSTSTSRASSISANSTSNTSTSRASIGSSSSRGTPLLSPPIPSYIPLIALVLNPYTQPAVNLVYFSYYRYLFAIGLGPIRPSNLLLYLLKYYP